MNKVIFLDVDGVLNNGIWAIEMFDKGIHVYHDDLLYEPSLEQLMRIVDSTGAVIVVSSSWRQIPIAYWCITCPGSADAWLQKARNGVSKACSTSLEIPTENSAASSNSVNG